MNREDEQMDIDFSFWLPYEDAVEAFSSLAEATKKWILEFEEKYWITLEEIYEIKTWKKKGISKLVSIFLK